MSYVLTTKDGRTSTYSTYTDEAYKALKDRNPNLETLVQVKYVPENSGRKDYKQRRRAYGQVADFFPQTTDDYDLHKDEPMTLEGAARRGISVLRDVGSMPMRGLMGGIDHARTGENTFGMTAEEAGAQGGINGFIQGVTRDPLFAATMLPIGRAYQGGQKAASGIGRLYNTYKAGNAASRPASKFGMTADLLKGTTIAGAVAEADNATRQEGYRLDPGIAAGVGAATAIAPFVGAKTVSYLKNRIAGFDRMTWEDLKALINRAFRGQRSKELSDIETMQLISSNPELVDEIARNANKPYLHEAQNRVNDETVTLLNNTPTPAMGEPGMLTWRQYQSPNKMAVSPTTLESELVAERDALKQSIKQAKKEGAPKAIIDEDTARLKELNSQIDEQKGLRNGAYAAGESDIVPMKNGATAPTDKRTEKFFDDLTELMMDANTEMAANWNTVGNRIRRNYKGDKYSVTPELIGNIANKEMNDLQRKVFARARSRNRGNSEADPVVTNEDLANFMDILAKNNMFEHMEALMKAATWLDEKTKARLMGNALKNKAYDGAISALDTPVKRIYQEPSTAGDVVKDKAKKIPVVSAFFKDGNGFPADFSNRYKAAADGTAYRKVIDRADGKYKRPASFVVPGMRVADEMEDRR